jgi:hypothetical protein
MILEIVRFPGFAPLVSFLFKDKAATLKLIWSGFNATIPNTRANTGSNDEYALGASQTC